MPPNARLSTPASSLTALLTAFLTACLALAGGAALAADVTFFTYSDIHYGVDGGGHQRGIAEHTEMVLEALHR